MLLDHGNLDHIVLKYINLKSQIAMGPAEGNYIKTHLKLDWSCHFYLQWRIEVYKSGISETLICKFKPSKKLKFDLRISIL